MQTAANISIIIKPVMTPRRTINPAKDFIDIGFGLVRVNGDFYLFTHLVQVFEELGQEWSGMNVKGGCFSFGLLIGRAG